MLGSLLLAALVGVSSAQWGWNGGFGYMHPAARCAYEPAKPRQGANTCDWLPIKDPGSGCIIRWTCRPIEPAPLPCPEAPAKPTTGKNCNWVTMRDERGCIVDYECEPVTQPPCPRRPQRPDNTQRCYYRAIKNNDGCVVDYECEPRRRMAMPMIAPLPAPTFAAPPPPIFSAPPLPPAMLPRIAAPVAAPFPAGNAWGNLNAAANVFNQAQISSAVATANAANAAAINNAAASFAPRLPYLKDDGQKEESFNSRKDTSEGCFNKDQEVDETGVSNCDFWALGAQCQENPEYMLDRCQKSCKVC